MSQRPSHIGIETAFIGLGSNIEPRVRFLLRALHILDSSVHIRVVQVSPAYASVAHTVDGSAQSDYINAVARIETSLDPASLLDRCLEIELALGRDRAREPRWGPRKVDLDILLFGAWRGSTSTLTVPHPRMKDRLFTLMPLRNVLTPNIELPGDTSTIDDLITACPDGSVPLKTIVSLRNYE